MLIQQHWKLEHISAMQKCKNFELNLQMVRAYVLNARHSGWLSGNELQLFDFHDRNLIKNYLKINTVASRALTRVTIQKINFLSKGHST